MKSAADMLLAFDGKQGRQIGLAGTFDDLREKGGSR
jgi:hypothetical protein